MKRFLASLTAVFVLFTCVSLQGLAETTKADYMLEAFSASFDPSVMNPNDVTDIGYAMPTFESTTENTEDGEALQLNWATTSNLKAYVHQMLPSAEWSTKTFAEHATDYGYLRLWISNPTFIQLQLTVRLHSAQTKVYMNATRATVSRKNGASLSFTTGDATGSGADSSITIPSAFSGWVAYPITLDATIGARGRENLTAFTDVNQIEIDVRRPETLDVGTYYILDNLCLSDSPIGIPQSIDSGETDASALPTEPIETELKNVIVLVGDGMGRMTLQATRDKVGNDLNMDHMWYKSAEIVSDNVTNTLTDSAAGGTALSCGVRTQNGYVALDKDGKAVETMVEYFTRAGKKTGLVTTSYLLDATPATYGSRAANRTEYTSVAREMFDNNISVLLGGGTNYFNDTVVYDGVTYPLIEYAKQVYNYEYVTTADALRSFNGEKVLGLYGTEYMAYEAERTSVQPSIEEMTEKAISLLENDDNGFFLMVEGGNIDHAAHANNLSLTRSDTVAFDKAVQVALDYMEENPDTLVVVCADHSTGGLTPSGTSYRFTTNQHDRSLTACFASGLGSRYFTDLKENADIAKAIKTATLEVQQGENDKPTSDRTALLEKVAEAEQIPADAYTSTSYKKLTTALQAARRITNSTAFYPQSVIDERLAAVEKALKGLVEKPVVVPDPEPTPEQTPDSKPDDGASKPVVTPPQNATVTANGMTVLYKNGKPVIGTTTAAVGGKTYLVVNGLVATGKTRVVKVSRSESYIVNKDGVVQKGKKNKLVKVGKKSYIVNKFGVIQKNNKSNKLVSIGKQSYIVNKAGVLQKPSKGYKLLKIGKKSYIVNKTGLVQKGKKKIKIKKITYKTNKKGVATKRK